MIFLIYCDRQHVKTQMDGNFHISHLGHKFPDTIPHSLHPTALTCGHVKPLKQSLGSPFKVISKAPVDMHWFSIMLLRKKTIMQAYTWKGTEIHTDLSHVRHTCCCSLSVSTGCSRVSLNSLCDCSRNVPIYRHLPSLLLRRLCTLPSPGKHQTSSEPI